MRAHTYERAHTHTQCVCTCMHTHDTCARNTPTHTRTQVAKATAFIRQALAEMERRGAAGLQGRQPPHVVCQSIEQVRGGGHARALGRPQHAAHRCTLRTPTAHMHCPHNTLPTHAAHPRCRHTLHTPTLQATSLAPATHAYSFWEGVPHSGKAAFGRLFAASKTLKVGVGG